jgi:hypothetical protein
MTILEYDGTTFEKAEVPIDGNRYENCTFIECRLIFSGTAPVYIQGCTFEHSNFVLAGAAELTVGFLTQLGNIRNGGEELLETFLNCIRAGVVPDASPRPLGVTLQ